MCKQIFLFANVYKVLLNSDIAPLEAKLIKCHTGCMTVIFILDKNFINCRTSRMTHSDFILRSKTH